MPPEPGPAPAIPVTVLTLTPVTCNWPEGDPKLAGFHFCGRDKPLHTAYCPHHAAIAYQPVR
jgi:GcrA cell cycle regulator